MEILWQQSANLNGLQQTSWVFSLGVCVNIRWVDGEMKRGCETPLWPDLSQTPQRQHGRISNLQIITVDRVFIGSCLCHDFFNGFDCLACQFNTASPLTVVYGEIRHNNLRN